MGIGAALAETLASEGVNLVLGARSEDKLRAVRDRCRALGVRAEVVPGDAAKDGTARGLVDAARSMGDFYGFIHAAGVLAPGPAVWELSAKRFREVLDGSLVAAHQLMRHAVPPLLDQGEGLAVFFGSGAAERAQTGIGAYCTAKAGEEHLARQLANEAPEITTVIWRPGVVETRMQADARTAEGSVAAPLRELFTSWQRDGLLLTPAQSARGLVDFLLGAPRAYHGKVADIRKV
jgi:NAD(P)-dependent dehydrogenase (short-subunit alcohol dehydrogenase family)